MARMVPHTFDHKNKTDLKYRVFISFFKENFYARTSKDLRQEIKYFFLTKEKISL